MMRCCLFLPDVLRQAAAKCAGNSATIGRDRTPAGRTFSDDPGQRRPTCQGCVTGRRWDLHEKGAQRMLEGGDRTVGIGEGGLEMGEYLRCRPGAGPAGDLGGSWGGGHRADSAVRILLWPWSKRFQMRCQVRSQRWRSAAQMASPIRFFVAALSRNRHRQPVVRLSRRILSAHQTLKVRPQPGRALRLLQKTRRARTAFCLGLLSSKPRKKPCRFSVPTTLQCGHGISLSCSANEFHSLPLRQNHRCSLTWTTPPRKS